MIVSKKGFIKLSLVCVSILLINVFMLVDSALPQVREGAKIIEYKSENLRDPFREESEITQEGQDMGQSELSNIILPNLNIQGVVWGGSIPQAIINNKIVKVGDSIEGAQVLGINKNGVILSFGNQEYTLSTKILSSQKNTETNQ